MRELFSKMNFWKLFGGIVSVYLGLDMALGFHRNRGPELYYFLVAVFLTFIIVLIANGIKSIIEGLTGKDLKLKAEIKIMEKDKGNA